ncbi:MAG TPA: hypothetical protein PKA98_08870 [Acidimicrobiales bacterium]|nr:hypothetical protein [Acidimicrobiales bacterium]
MLTILLPPSEGKDPGGVEGTAWAPDQGRFGALADERRQVAEALVAAGGGDAKLLGAKGDLLDRAQEANRSVLGAPTLKAMRRISREHPIEEVGEKLRGMMPWIKANKLVDRDRN